MTVLEKNSALQKSVDEFVLTVIKCAARTVCTNNTAAPIKIAAV